MIDQPPVLLHYYITTYFTVDAIYCLLPQSLPNFLGWALWDRFISLKSETLTSS